MTEFATNVIHGNHSRIDLHGVLRPPVYDTVAFEHDSSTEDINPAFTGKKLAHVYSRITNPTVEEFENRNRDLSGPLKFDVHFFEERSGRT